MIIELQRGIVTSFVAAAASLILSISSAWAASITRSETKGYVALATGDLILECNFASSGYNLGGACFQVQGNENTSGFTVNDERLGPVFARYSWRNSAGTELGWGNACGSASNLVIPASSTTLVVQVYMVGQLSCGRATKGSIIATFTRPLN